MKRLLKILAKLVKGTVIVIVSVIVLGVTVNSVLTQVEKKTNPPMGTMVDVNGGKMHVYVKGNGPKTVVLMSGLGTTSPVLDFMPLVQALEKDYTVCVVENFGYGWSGATDSPRTNENIIDETRMALQQAKVSPPYILVPHSISGIYALYYANQYPQEVQGIVGLETSFPEQVNLEGAPPSSAMNIYGIARMTGVLRAAIGLDPSLLEYETDEYSDSDIKKIGMITCWNMGNKTVINETASIMDNCKNLLGQKIPENIPVRMVLSNQTILERKSTPQKIDWVLEHEKLIEGNTDGKIEILEGGHYIHYGNAERIVALINGINN